MARAKIKNLKSVIKNMEKVFESTKESKRALDDVGEFITDRIVKETRKGKDLVNETRQLPLSDGYKKWRRKVKSGDSSVEPSPIMRPNVSHLTLTGELLDSLKYSIKKSKGLITIEPTGKREDGKSNANVATDLANRGRVFLGLDKRGVKRVRRLFLDELRRNINKFFKK